MQGILSLTIPTMRLLGYNPSLLPGGPVGSTASHSPHAGEHIQESAGTAKTIAFKFASLSDLPAPARWGLNE